ncbi:PAS domain S-box protein [Brumimicrobium glaciale]|uniref:histidine kinase n=1 Tax=Brumimicrobium glaciale TaxID=200475 RepID=A0A4Q4KK94_9FLAO|nr:PAS domain S-box protein [Brumimicrobium glaciale]RYM33388.1 PAS domain S-box protein [Brumimicrobium glaciale]
MEKLIYDFINHIRDGVQITNLNGDLCYMNSIAKERIGIEGDIKDINVKDFEPIYKEESNWEEHVKELRKNEFLTIRSENTNLLTQKKTPVEVSVFIKDFEGKEYVLAISKDITSIVHTEYLLERREKMLEAIADATTELSFNLDFYDSISKSLSIIGDAVNVDRTYLFEFHNNSEGEELISQRLEWNSGIAESQINNPELQNLSVQPMEEFIEPMRKNEPYQTVVSELPQQSQVKIILASQGIKSALIIPIFYKDTLWGMIGYDDCKNKRIWSSVEISILRTFSSNISLNIERKINSTEVKNLASFHLQSPEPIIRIDLRGKVILRNHYSKEIERQKLCLEKGKWISFDELSLLIIKNLNSNKSINHFKVNTENGKYYTITPKYIEKQKFINLYFNEITTLIQAQQKLEKAQQIIDRIVNNMQDVIWSVNLFNSEIIFVSPTIENLIGLNEKEIQTKVKNLQILQLLEPEDLARISKDLKLTGETDCEVYFNKNKEHKWFRLRIKAKNNLKGQIIRLDGYINDITLKHQYDENLKTQEKKYRGIISNINLGLIELDDNQHVTNVNESYEKISGYSKSELIGQNINNFVHSKNNKKIVEDKSELRKKGITDSYEIEIITKTGLHKWWLVSGAPNYDENGIFIGSLVVCLDVTEQKRTQEKMQEAQEIAETANAAKELFIINMSHEIRTPLNAIIGLSHQLEKFKQEEKGYEYIKHIIDSGNHLQSLIDNILDFSKINAGKLELNNKMFNFKEVFNDIISILSPLAMRRRLKFISTIDKNISFGVLADRTRIKQILINVISNSIKFTESGEVNFNVVSKKISSKLQMLIITISDTGVGMSKIFLNNIFDKFSQADSSSIRKESGTGLGMPITYELLKLMNGSIKLESELGKGTKTTIKIPVIYEDYIESLIDIPSVKTVNLSSKKILVVEDNVLNLILTKKILENSKIEIFTAKNGVEAIEALEDLVVDLILMDIQMPLKDGIETTKILIQEKGIKTPIVALSANAFKAEIDKCYAVGMVDYLTKPYLESDLMNVIRKHIL